MKISPITNRIVASPVDLSQETASGIVLKHAVGKTSNTAKIVAIGPDVKNVKVGDIVIYINNMTFNFEGEGYVTFMEHEILGTVN